MDHLQSLQVFVKVAELEGFSAAARALAMSPPTVTRAVSSLEDRIGTRLLTRTTRSVRLTDSGQRFLEDCRRILADLEEAEEAAVGRHSAPRGELRITAPLLFGRLYVAPILADFLDQHPKVNCLAQFVDRNVNLMDEGLDVAIRIGNLPDSSLTAVRAGTVRWVVFAAPDYLRRHGPVRVPADLAGHRLIQSIAVERAAEWRFQENGMAVSVRIEPRLRVNSNDVAAGLVAAGWGISRLLSYQIAPYLRDGRVQIILDAYELPPMPIHVVHQEGRMVSTKIRAFVDYMVDRLRADPAIN